jgi:hypothetical protein
MLNALVHLHFRPSPLLISPMSRNPFFGILVHGLGTNLNLKGAALFINYGRMERL